MVRDIELQIDRLQMLVPPLRLFILPGGTYAAAQAHVCRTVCRRAERDILRLAETGAEVDAQVLAYINRLSDYFFALARKLKGSLKRGFIGYGYLPLMNFRNCPARANIGCGECSGESCLTDRKGESFRLLCKDRRYSQLLNCVPLYAADRSLPPADFETLYFTTESREEAQRVAELYTQRKALDGRRTAGLYFRELL